MHTELSLFCMVMCVTGEIQLATSSLIVQTNPEMFTNILKINLGLPYVPCHKMTKVCLTKQKSKHITYGIQFKPPHKIYSEDQISNYINRNAD